MQRNIQKAAISKQTTKVSAFILRAYGHIKEYDAIFGIEKNFDALGYTSDKKAALHRLSKYAVEGTLSMDDVLEAFLHAKLYSCWEYFVCPVHTQEEAKHIWRLRKAFERCMGLILYEVKIYLSNAKDFSYALACSIYGIALTTLQSKAACLKI